MTLLIDFVSTFEKELVGIKLYMSTNKMSSAPSEDSDQLVQIIF